MLIAGHTHISPSYTDTATPSRCPTNNPILYTHMKITAKSTIVFTVNLSCPHEFTKEGLEDMYTQLAVQLEDQNLSATSIQLKVDDNVEVSSDG